jgi:hypothetical protein
MLDKAAYLPILASNTLYGPPVCPTAPFNEVFECKAPGIA